MSYFSQIFGVSKAEQLPIISNWRKNDQFAKQFGINGFGVATLQHTMYRRVGDTLEVKIVFNNGTLESNPASIGLPKGISIDFSKLRDSVDSNGNSYLTQVGLAFAFLGTGSSTIFDNSAAAAVVVNGQTTDAVYLSTTTGNSQFLVANGTSFDANTVIVNMSFSIPIKEWNITA